MILNLYEKYGMNLIYCLLKFLVKPKSGSGADSNDPARSDTGLVPGLLELVCSDSGSLPDSLELITYELAPKPE